MNTDETPGPADESKPEKGESFPKEVRLTYDTKPIENLIKAIDQQTNSQKEGTESAKSIAKGEVNAQKDGNIIAKRGLYINAILGGITIVAIFISAKAVNEASRAANAAERADSIYIATLKWDSLKNAQASIADSIKFQKQFDLAGKSLIAQINSLEETHRNFEKENEPFLQDRPKHFVSDTFL